MNENEQPEDGAEKTKIVIAAIRNLVDPVTVVLDDQAAKAFFYSFTDEDNTHELIAVENTADEVMFALRKSDVSAMMVTNLPERMTIPQPADVTQGRGPIIQPPPLVGGRR